MPLNDNAIHICLFFNWYYLENTNKRDILALFFMIVALIITQNILKFDCLWVNEQRAFIIENPLMSLVIHTKVDTNSVLRTCSWRAIVKMSTSLSTVICSRALYTTKNGPQRVAPSLKKSGWFTYCKLTLMIAFFCLCINCNNLNIYNYIYPTHNVLFFISERISNDCTYNVC